MRKILLLFAISLSLASFAQSKDEQAIRKVLNEQVAAWNKGNIDQFMEGYWKSDSLMFIGKNGINWGWQTTLENYKRGYPDTTAMGKLSFDLLVIKKLSADYYFIVGKWHLKRTIGDVGGHYDLVFRKIGGKWLIISDHTS
jgi:ketosteroid isomerase-like protein